MIMEIIEPFTLDELRILHKYIRKATCEAPVSRSEYKKLALLTDKVSRKLNHIEYTTRYKHEKTDAEIIAQITALEFVHYVDYDIKNNAVKVFLLLHPYAVLKEKKMEELKNILRKQCYFSWQIISALDEHRNQCE